MDITIAETQNEQEELQLQEELRQSIRQGCSGFFLQYQPQILCRDYTLHGLEALLRYRSPALGFVPPNRFIPFLESSGLIVPVGTWVLETAMGQCAAWRRQLPRLHISVNVSYLQLAQPGFDDLVLELLDKTGLPGSALTLELTESIQLQDSRYVNRLCSRLNNRGVSISIDDFGTGYSNLSSLKMIHVDEIKIDRCFVSRVQHSAYNYRLLSNMIELAHSAGIRVCCEGLETEQELTALKELHPDLLQGFLLGRPYSREQVEHCFLDPTHEEYIRWTRQQAHYRELSAADDSLRIGQAQQEQLSTIVESMEEMLYVRDPQTHALLYMNGSGRALTGVYDYKGRQCYQVLCGRNSPCENCNTGCLGSSYQVREFHNTYLGRHFLMKEKQILWQNQPAELTIAIDITQKEIISRQVREKLEFEQNIVDCTRMLTEETDRHKAINGVLRSIGTFYDADRAYLFLLQENRQFWDNTHEWCAQGITPQIGMLQDVPVSTTRRWQELFCRGESILIEDIRDIREISPEEYGILAAQDITSLIVSPIWQDSAAVGFIGVDNPRKHATDCGQVQTMALFLADRIQKDSTRDRLEELLDLHYEDILQTTDLGLWVIRMRKDGSRCEMYADRTMRRILGIREDLSAEACYRYWYDRINDGYYHYVNYSVADMVRTGRTVELCYTWNHPEKGPVTVRCLGTRVQDMGDMICLEGYHREINEVDRPNFLPDNKSIIFEYHENQHSVYFHSNRGPLSYIPNRLEDFPGCWVRTGVVHPHFVRRFEAVFSDVQHHPELTGEEFLLKTAEGTYEWFKMKTHRMGDDRKDADTIVVILDPARQERAMELDFMRQKDFYSAILGEKLAYAEIDIGSRRILSSGGLWSAYMDTERDYESVLLERADPVIHPQDTDRYARFISTDTLHRIMAQGRSSGTLQLRRLIEGRMCWVELTGHIFQDSLTGNIYALLYLKDIDAQKRQQLEQEHAATRDPLTQVYNRAHFQEEVTRHILSSGSSGCGTLIILDLDNFKSINDTYGHDEGDRVLRQMADVLMSTFRRKDLIGRFGGDEFLIFLKDTADRKTIDHRLGELRAALADGNKHNCSCSIGITFTTRSGFHYDTSLKQADQALYKSKARGKNRHTYFEDIRP